MIAAWRSAWLHRVAGIGRLETLPDAGEGGLAVGVAEQVGADDFGPWLSCHGFRVHAVGFGLRLTDGAGSERHRDQQHGRQRGQAFPWIHGRDGTMPGSFPERE